MRRCLIALALSTLAACSGGSGNTGETKASFASVVSFGASLTDSGTFGYKFTVQPAEGQAAYLLWNERIAGAYGVDDICPAYTATSSTTFSTNAGCTNFAIGGSNVNNYSASSNAANNASPISILAQLATAAQTVSFSDDTLVLVGGDSGANDVANMLKDLLTAVLTYQQTHSASAFNGFLGRVQSLASSLPSDSQAAYGTALQAAIAQLQAAAATSDTTDDVTALAQIGGVYETALADLLAGTVQQTVLAAGATHVVVQNTLDVTKTPQFQLGIPQQIVAALTGAGYTQDQANAAAQQLLATLSQVADAWLKVYNAELASKFTDDKRVVVVDFYTHFNNEMADPTQYGLTNVTTPACALTTAGDDLHSCSATLLSASIPANETSADWWKTYIFANSFHPTPYGHQLLAEMVTDALAKAGWL